jgi:hypothetical protein
MIFGAICLIWWDTSYYTPWWSSKTLSMQGIWDVPQKIHPSQESVRESILVISQGKSVLLYFLDLLLPLSSPSRPSSVPERLPMPSFIKYNLLWHHVWKPDRRLNTCWPYSAPQTGNCTELAPAIGPSRRIRKVLALPCAPLMGSSLKR